MERLYSILEIMKIKDIVRFHSETTTPIPGVVYHLYSLPSFDNNQTREELLGQDIQSNKFTVPNRCILFNKLNVRFKRIWRIDSDEDHKISSTEFLPLIIDENKVDFDYCFYLLASPAITDYLCGQNANTSGSHKRIDPTNFFNIGIKLPPLAQQYEIGKLLSSLDTKIKLNRAINQNLEAMAKQLYDYWFVQFDFPNEEGKPYKSSGGTMVWNEKLKRFIPKGWESTTLGNECHMYQPKTLGLSELDEAAKYKVYGANGVIGKYHTYNHENSEIAMACRGNSCGTVNRTAPFSWITGNAMVIKMIDGSIHNEYIKQALQYANVDGAISGSGQPQLTRENLNSIKLCKPTRELIIRFSEQVSNIVEMYLQNESNIEELTKQRDELLPLLMNGQVSVNSDLSAH